MSRAFLRDDPPELETSSRAIPAGLHRILDHCLEKSADLRFRSAHDIAFALENLSGGGSELATGAMPASSDWSNG